MSQSGKCPESVEEILGELRDLAEREDSVSVGDVLDAIGDRSYGPAVMLPAMTEWTPVGGIPGVPTLLAAIIAITGIQLVIDKDHLWLPDMLQRRSASGQRLRKAADRLERPARWLDRRFHRRLSQFVRDPWPRIAGFVILLLCLAVPPLELVPFASTAPMVAIAAFGLALLVRDGLLMLAALVLSVAALVTGASLVSDIALPSWLGR